MPDKFSWYSMYLKVIGVLYGLDVMRGISGFLPNWKKIPDSLTLSGVDLYSEFILPVMPDKFSWYSMYLQSDK
jgi:hypothetical protein